MRLSEVVGHKRLTTLISRAIDRDTLPPTLLFAGPSGVGKRAVAHATAQAVNCLEPVRNLREEPPSEDEARDSAALADGSIGQALGLSDIDLTTLRDLAVLLLRQTAGKADTQARLDVTAKLWGPPKNERSRQDLSVVLRLASSMLRDIEVINSAADQRVLANPALADDLLTLARHFPDGRARTAFGAVDRALMALERQAGTKVVTEWLAVQI